MKVTGAYKRACWGNVWFLGISWQITNQIKLDTKLVEIKKTFGILDVQMSFKKIIEFIILLIINNVVAIRRASISDILDQEAPSSQMEKCCFKFS